MTFISYAQNFEDVMLWRALGHIQNGFYIDVGANDPVIDSVTKAFYDNGWIGINIEPVEAHYLDLHNARNRDINLHMGASNFDGEAEIIIPSTRGWASLSDNMIEKYANEDEKALKLTIPVQTLDKIWHDYHRDGVVHFLKVDVENYEKQVLEGLTLTIHRPWIIVIESTLPNSRHENGWEWEHLLLNHDYAMVYFDGLNRFYCANEQEHLKQYFVAPPNVFDNFIRYREYYLNKQLMKIRDILNML